MTLEDAKKVLGLDPSEDPASHVDKFMEARERIAGLVRDAPNETIALRYQDGLLEFDKAMAAVREEIERRKGEKVANLMALVPGAVSGQHVSSKRADFHKPTEDRKALEPAKDVVAKAPASVNSEEDVIPPEVPENRSGTSSKFPDVAPAKRIPEVREQEGSDGDFSDLDETGSSSKGRFLVYAIVFLLIGGIGGGWIYTSREAAIKERNQIRIIALESLGARLVESRRWPEALEAYREIEERDPGSEIADRGIRSIEFGMAEEQSQFVGYWSGEALAAFEGGRLDDAAEAAKKVLEKYPSEKDAVELLSKIEAERVVRVRQAFQEKIRSAVENRDWSAADSALASFSAAVPEDPLIRELADEISQGKDQERRDFSKARELADAARIRDEGKFDPQALEWMREAVSLAPEDQEIKALYEKLSSYSRTLRVPEDRKTLAEALAEARDRDRIVLGEGSFSGGAVINKAIQLEGAGEGKTVLVMKAQLGPVLTIGPGAKSATVTGLTLQHEGFDVGTSRYPIALVRGAEVEFSDCEFLEGSGHGLAVIDAGHAVALRCVFKTNGWDGAAASGANSRITIRESKSTGNFGHGFEVWDGASAVIANSKASRNSRNGVLIDSAGEDIEVTGGEFFGNREYGIVLNAGASGKVLKNSCYSNIMGGLLVRFAAISVVVEENRIEKNSGPGLVLEQGLRPEIYAGNMSRSNLGRDLMSEVRFQE